jgi:hypothetical protein
VGVFADTAPFWKHQNARPLGTGIVPDGKALTKVAVVAIERKYLQSASLRLSDDGSAGGGRKKCGQPHGPRCRDTTCESKARRALWGNDARRYTVPTASHPRPQALPFARCVEPRRAARLQKWEL